MLANACTRHQWIIPHRESGHQQLPTLPFQTQQFPLTAYKAHITTLSPRQKLLHYRLADRDSIGGMQYYMHRRILFDCWKGRRLAYMSCIWQQAWSL